MNPSGTSTPSSNFKTSVLLLFGNIFTTPVFPPFSPAATSAPKLTRLIWGVT